SLNLTFVPETLALGGAVVSCAPVDRVLLRRRTPFSRPRAVGVKGRFVHPITREKGARFLVRARRAVVMAASATWTPILLQRSGVRHPALGAGFQSHPGTAIFGFYDDPVDMNAGATQGWASVHYRASHGLKLE